MKRVAAALLFALSPAISQAVYLSPEGLGQSLIYPYYTVQSANGDTFNTYMSLVNHTADAKALRVRLRESRNGRGVGEFNLYLAPHDTWTAALVPDAGGGARLVSSDVSCNGTTGAAPLAFTLSTAAFNGAGADGNGTDASRTREGFVEVIEMGATTDAFIVGAVTHTASSPPTGCGAVEAAITTSVSPPLHAPSGGLSGGLTLINVASGMNFTVNAEALDGLASKPFFRRAPDDYVTFNAAEIDPVSVVATDNAIYRAYWGRAVDAVSAALMRSEASAEFVLDSTTASHTEIVATFPTRHFYLPSDSSARMSAPFALGKPGWAPDCHAGTVDYVGLGVYDEVFDREGSSIAGTSGPGVFGLPPALYVCASAAILEVTRDSVPTPAAATGLLGSVSRGFRNFGVLGHENGWLSWLPDANARLTSLATSVRIDALTGMTSTESQTYWGFPMVGFSARSFTNGTLSCASGRCVGNYGGAYPLQFTRKITSP